MEPQELEAIKIAAEQDAVKAKTAAAAAESAATVAIGHKDAIGVAADNIASTLARSTQSAEEAERQLKELRETLKNSITASLGGAFDKKAKKARERDYMWLAVLGVALYFLYAAGTARYAVLSGVIEKMLTVMPCGYIFFLALQ